LDKHDSHLLLLCQKQCEKQFIFALMMGGGEQAEKKMK